jgi:hypothetical protein
MTYPHSHQHYFVLVTCASDGRWDLGGMAKALTHQEIQNPTEPTEPSDIQ